MTRVLVDLGGNVEMSRMARLGGEFAILMLISLPADHIAGLEKDLEILTARGYKVTTTQVSPTHAEAHPDWLPYRIEVHAADHEGHPGGSSPPLRIEGSTSNSWTRRRPAAKRALRCSP